LGGHPGDTTEWIPVQDLDVHAISSGQSC